MDSLGSWVMFWSQKPEWFLELRFADPRDHICRVGSNHVPTEGQHLGVNIHNRLCIPNSSCYNTFHNSFQVQHHHHQPLPHQHNYLHFTTDNTKGEALIWEAPKEQPGSRQCQQSYCSERDMDLSAFPHGQQGHKATCRHSMKQTWRRWITPISSIYPYLNKKEKLLNILI